MENAIAATLFKEGNSTSQVVESQETKCMAAFFATEEGSAVLYEAVKKFMSTSDGIMIVENAIVAAVGSKGSCISHFNVYAISEKTNV